MLFDHPWMSKVEPGLYVCTFPAEPTEEQSREAIALAEEFYSTNTEPFSWVMDNSYTTITGSDARGRRLWADHLNRNREYFGEHCAGVALVLPNRMMRLMVKAITWIAPFNFDSEIFDTYAPAETWLREQIRSRLHEAGLETIATQSTE